MLQAFMHKSHTIFYVGEKKKFYNEAFFCMLAAVFLVQEVKNPLDWRSLTRDSVVKLILGERAQSRRLPASRKVLLEQVMLCRQLLQRLRQDLVLFYFLF